METLKDESIAVQRELRIEQVQLSLERLVVGRGFSAQARMKRGVDEAFPLAFA